MSFAFGDVSTGLSPVNVAFMKAGFVRRDGEGSRDLAPDVDPWFS